jgi:hypothetical protein
MIQDKNHDISNRDIIDLLDKQFLGVVEAIDDPRKEGRARIRVNGIYTDIPTGDLPWAYPKQKNTVFGQAGKCGSISIPKIGSIVAVCFDNGNPYSPEYYSVHEIAQDVKDELNQEYEGSHFILFDGDQQLKIWFSKSKGLTLVVKDASINIKEQNVEIKVIDSSINIKEKEVKIKVGDGKNSGKVIIDAPNIELGEGATQALIKGNAFMTLFNTHTHASQGAPPAVLMSTSHLSLTSKTK